MSKKRTSPESGNDDQTNEGSDSVFQQDDNAKRAKLTLLSNATMQDLPIEVIESILFEAVVMEVKGMKLVKSVWKEKADLVMNRLGDVCVQWSDIIDASLFRKEVYRTLEEATAPESIKLEIVQQVHLPYFVYKVTTLRDEIFLMVTPGKLDFVIHVYDRNNMAKVKDVIPLPGIRATDMAACNVSNCVYVLNMELCSVSVQRIKKDAYNQFNISSWITGFTASVSGMSVTREGSLVILCEETGQKTVTLYEFCDNGVLRQKLLLPAVTEVLSCGDKVLPKAGGDFIIASVDAQCQTVLTEVDANGQYLRVFRSPLGVESSVSFCDTYDRILIYEKGHRLEVLDSEFNKFPVCLPSTSKLPKFDYLHFDSTTNQVIGVKCADFRGAYIALMKFREGPSV